MIPSVIGKMTGSAAIVFALAAALTTPVNAATYRLTQNSTYIEGCFELCACPLVWYGPMTGRFRLHPLSVTGTYDVYAVTNVHWNIGGNLNTVITGHGTYTVFSEFALLNRMELDLVRGSSEVMHYDSGMVPVGAPWPSIRVLVAVNGAPACYDWRIDIAARRVHGDINDDGEVNIDDLLAVITNWGDCPPRPDACPSDIAPTPTGDHTVNIDDLLTVIADW